ncbi:hypothetical protein [Reyranella soli]|nr:hypothetical protein [Reyranella soli]
MRIDFPIPVDKLRLGPLHATWASISISVSPDDLELVGGLGFEFEGLGSGRLEARAAKAIGGGAPAGVRTRDDGGF